MLTAERGKGGKLLESCTQGDDRGFLERTSRLALGTQDTSSPVTISSATHQGVDVGRHRGNSILTASFSQRSGEQAL